MLQSETMQGLLTQEYQALHDWETYVAWCLEKEMETKNIANSTFN